MGKLKTFEFFHRYHIVEPYLMANETEMAVRVRTWFGNRGNELPLAPKLIHLS